MEELSAQQVADIVAQQLDADVILYNGPLFRPHDTRFIEACIRRRRRENVILMLITEGGAADPAYRIARCLQTKYKRFFLYVSGYCKSAGTLVATGAHELVVSDHGELGPLDVQMSKKDELLETQSGLTVVDTLTALQDNAFMAFEKFFLDLTTKSGGSITLKTATQIATNMTTGLFAPLYGQVDPLHIGEAGRAMSIASRYGQRLLGHGCNIESNALEFITSEYPSHGFVIDRQEASNLFKEVREPTRDETLLAEKLDEKSRLPDKIDIRSRPPFEFLSTELPAVDGEGPEEGEEENHETRSGGVAKSELGAVAEETPEKLGGSDDEESSIAELHNAHQDRDSEHSSA